jgi:membrane protein DedA with SNARE-associated domain
MDLLPDLKLWLLILLVSALGTIPPLTYYAVGKRGTHAVLERFPQVTEERWEKAHRLYEKHGVALTFFTAVPMIGIVASA